MAFPKTAQEYRDQGYKWLNNGTCKACGAFIHWVQTPKNKKIPLNRDLTPHWSNCPKAEQFRKKG